MSKVSGKRPVEEYMPSPKGRRIVPKIDDAMKLKLDKMDQLKENKGTKVSKKVNLYTGFLFYFIFFLDNQRGS